LGAQSYGCVETANTSSGSVVNEDYLNVPLSTWNAYAAASNGFLPVATAGGLGWVLLDGAELTVAVLGSEVVVTIAAAGAIGAAAGAVVSLMGKVQSNEYTAIAQSMVGTVLSNAR
jgi:hypothetical protein